MYCVKCGVELQRGVTSCPLCGLPVYHPELQEEPEPRPYPRPAGEETVSRGGLLFLVTFAFLLPLAVCLLTDLLTAGAVTWSGYAAFGLLTAYVAVCLPLWFRRPDPVIFFPIAAAAALGLALYVCLKTGGRWFLPFAFPAGGAAALIVEAVIVLLRHAVGPARHRILYILGGASVACGGLCLLVEFLLKVAFGTPMTWWSLYPLSALALLGAMLIAVGASPALRRSLHKKFFI